jgi:hypothetical protein
MTPHHREHGWVLVDQRGNVVRSEDGMPRLFGSEAEAKAYIKENTK